MAQFTAGELAQNPELQAKVGKIVKEHFVPRAKNVVKVARENNPLKDPKKFLSETFKKVRDRAKR